MNGLIFKDINELVCDLSAGNEHRDRDRDPSTSGMEREEVVSGLSLFQKQEKEYHEE